MIQINISNTWMIILLLFCITLHGYWSMSVFAIILREKGGEEAEKENRWIGLLGFQEY